MDLSFQTLLHRTARSCGLQPARLRVEEAETFASWIQQRLAEAWHATIWPDTCAIEERVITTPSSVAFTADSTEITSDSTAHTADETTVAEPYSIGLTATRMGELLNVWRQDPRRNNAPRELSFWGPVKGRAYLPTDAPATVWIRYRLAERQFTATAYDATVTYQAGDVFLYTDGHCYLVTEPTTAGDTPVTEPLSFEIQTIPSVLAPFTEAAARADWLLDDGQDDKATAQLTRAQKLLTDRMADLTVLQHQSATYTAA